MLVKNNAELMAEEAEAEKTAGEAKQFGIQPEAFRTELAAHIREAWFSAKREKTKYATQMIENLRQKHGEYSPNKLADIKLLGSDVFMMITDTKCRSAVAWIKDIIFQPGAIPWDIEPTPVPKLTPELEQMAIQTFVMEAQQFYAQMAMSAQAGMIDPMQFQSIVQQSIPEFERRFKRLIVEVAREKAQNMKLKIQDQLIEGNYYEALSDVVWNIVVLKAGFLKGAVYRKKKVRKLVVDPRTRKAKPLLADEVIPEWESRSPFDIFPGPGAITVNDSYLIDRLSFSRTDLQNMIGLEGFDEVAIREILREYQDGGLREWSWGEQERLEAEGRESSQYYDWDKIDCLEFWGPVPGKMLLEWGMKEKDVPDPDFDYQICAWLIDRWILKCILNPNPLGRRPFYKASYVEEPGTFWGMGLPETISDAQAVCNAVARAIVNNVGIASGPQVELNIDRLAPGENQDQMWPWRVWKVTREMMSSGKAIDFYQPSLHGSELVQIYNTFSKIADEHSGIPSYAHGDPQVGGAGNTASGLSMLMGSSARGIKSVLMTVDRHIMEPSIEDQYYDNYELDDALEYIGDVKICAKGSSALLAKEQKALRLTEFAKATANNIDIQIIGAEGRRYILRETAKSLDLEVEKAVPDQDMIQPIPPPPAAAPQPGQAMLDQAGNPAQGAGTELFKPGA